ncbi:MULTISPECIES: PhoX family protein [Nostocales]|uniref:PhoX family phosphatase n=3 Tax=Nostocales TaxID=1161 RepID=A0A0C1QUL6_9CYAN|nr:PhoX family phosphatase [Tolypothrix bouteillei]KAF3885068.1 PhoX family phosphatase [Tolypothrix bouteillei VB521301]
MSKLGRRQILLFFAGTAGAVAIDQILGGAAHVGQARGPRSLSFTPVRLPHPLEIYQDKNSFLPESIGQGKVLDSSNLNLASYKVIDDVVVPPEYERYVIVSWGDRVFPNKEEYFGYNCDYTGFIPIDGSNDEGYLWVNHEYVSYPISFLAPETPTNLTGYPTVFENVIGFSLPSERGIALDGEFLYNLGGSIVRIRRENSKGRFVVVKGDAKNRRLHGLSGLGINSERRDGYEKITSWGSLSYQQGDENYLLGTGPAAREVFSLSSDGLGNRIIGTAYNCSGGTTPWGTILSGEENFQGGTDFFVGVTESVKPDGTQTGYTKGTVGETFGLVGEKYGWIVEVDPADPHFRPRKHTWLGRFRHENVGYRAEAGNKLIAYLGDDRRGGHTWKFVSEGTIDSVTDKSNSQLWEAGTLYVARFNPDGTGQWIAINSDTPTNPIRPSVISSVEFDALGAAQRDGLLKLPRRKGIAEQTEDGGAFNCDRKNEATALPDYQNKKLSDFYTSQGAILSDAFLAANLAGGTPTARPEDLEVHPYTKEVFIAYTDGAPGSDGYPDSRIFQVAKLSPAVNATQQSGGLYKIIEDSEDGTGTSFRWERFKQGGEDGSELGAGFANVDNLLIDPKGNVWGVTDMSTDTHNGFSLGANPTPNTINHTATGNVSTFTGVFGNNWLFVIPTKGPDAGKVIPFAYGPVRCEMTGPTLVGDTLVISVQHPGENVPINDGTQLSRTIELLDLDGKLFNQTRTLPRGSSWPSNIPTEYGGEGNATGVPRPSVIGIHRKDSKGRFF